MTSSTARARAALRTAPTGVLVGTPAHGGMVTSDYATALAATTCELKSRDIAVSISIWPNTGLLPLARASIVAEFLSWEPGSHLVFVDADTGWMPSDLVQLVGHGLDMVTGAVPLRTSPLKFNVTPLCDAQGGFFDRDTRTGCLEVAACGAAFLAISRVALLRMVAAYPELRITDPGAAPAATLPYLYDLFAHGRDNKGSYVGEDTAFCRRWTAIGGRIWLDPSIRLRHHGSYAYEGDPMTMFCPAQTHQDQAPA